MAKSKRLNWDLLREEYRYTELSLTEFAKSKGIARSTAANRFKDITEEKRKGSIQTEAEEEAEFIPIEVLEKEAPVVPDEEVTFIKTSDIREGAPAGSSSLELKVSYFSISLHPGFDKETLRDALEVLRELC